MTIYTDKGYKDRNDYLRGVATDFGVSMNTVLAISDAHGGSNEDFDGLVRSLEDWRDEFDEENDLEDNFDDDYYDEN